jgi:hypothetical protein
MQYLKVVTVPKKMPYKGYFLVLVLVEFLYKQKLKKMKKNLRLLALIICTTLIFSSCKKSAASPGTASGSATSANLAAGKCDVRFTYSGASSGNFASTLAISAAASSGALYNISGSTLNGITPQIALILMPANTAVGTYAQPSAGADLPNNMVFSLSSGSDGWASGGGTAAGFKIVVTSVSSSTVEGTFSGDLGSDNNSTKITIANGSFAARF